MQKLTLAVALLCSGCVASYQHQSSPALQDDGYDLLCAGVEQDAVMLRARADLCRNIHGGNYVRFTLEYRP